jgi:hypothetical protein
VRDVGAHATGSSVDPFETRPPCVEGATASRLQPTERPPSARAGGR